MAQSILVVWRKMLSYHSHLRSVYFMSYMYIYRVCLHSIACRESVYRCVMYTHPTKRFLSKSCHEQRHFRMFCLKCPLLRTVFLTAYVIVVVSLSKEKEEYLKNCRASTTSMPNSYVHSLTSAYSYNINDLTLKY